MKIISKSLANLFRRAGALLSSLLMICCLSVSVLAASETEADMPSNSDFLSHIGSWFVWRTRVISGKQYFELCASPVTNPNSSDFPEKRYKSESYFDIAVISGSDTRYHYACALPHPFYGTSGSWSELPSFPVGASSTSGSSALVSLYCRSSSFPSYSYSCFLTPVYSPNSSSVTFSNTINSSSDSLSVADFPSPFFSYPFAFRSSTSSSNSSYVVQGGSSDCINSSLFDNKVLNFKSSCFLSSQNLFVSPPFSYTCPSSNLGLVVIKNVSPPSSGTINSASAFAPPDNFYLNATLLVPSGFLPNVEIGDWLSDSPEDLQKALTNEFNVDSGTLKDSKQNFDSWQNSNTIDTDVANTSLDAINALMQNVGQFVAIVSLLCFGAVVLRVLIRKAVEG